MNHCRSQKVQIWLKFSKIQYVYVDLLATAWKIRYGKLNSNKDKLLVIFTLFVDNFLEKRI